MSNKTILSINGITCSHCAKGIEQHLKQIGLADAQVNFSSQSASFSPLPTLSIKDVISSLDKIGYKASLKNISDKKNKFSALELMTVFCCLLAAPLLMHGFLSLQILNNSLFQLTLTLPIMLSGGVYFTKSAIRSLKLGKPNMDVLIALGTWSAFIYSLIGTVFSLGHNYLFYETSASIIAIVLLGNLIEHKAIIRTEKSILDLQQLQPEFVKIRKSAGETINIPVEEIKINDHIILSPGDRVPCDGSIIEGNAELDLAFLTGESVPKNVKAGESVTSGSLMLGGFCIINAEKVGAESSLFRIIEGIQASRAAKPELEKLADKVTNYFVPVVLVIAVISFFLNLGLGAGLGQSLLRSIAILVVSCPCALGLATPTAVTVALGLASKSGILVRKASLFEVIPKIKHFMFDKTGTLTDGQFKIQDFVVEESDRNYVLAVLASMEANSNHPIARAIRDYCEANNVRADLRLQQKNEQRGLGVTALSESGDLYELSSRDVPENFNLALRVNSEIIAKLKLQDNLKSEAAYLIEQIRNKGCSAEILSGDSFDKTAGAAKILGIKKFKAQLLPEDKAKAVADAAKQADVAFIGDGINDSAALASAQTGITFSNSSDLARQSADIVIVSGGLNKILDLINLSQKTTSSIRQNLFWAFFYNILMIPIAALGYLSPMHAAFAMVFSDLIVVANSLRLKLWKAKKHPQS